MRTQRETPADPVAEAQSAADRAARAEARKAKARKRAAESYRRRKAAKKVSVAQPASTPSGDSAASAAGAARSEGLGDVLAAEYGAPGAEASPSAEEIAAQKALEQFGSPEKVAAFMAQMQKVAEVAASKSERSMKVVAALGWANADGTPSDPCLMGVQLAWPWLSAGGLEWLAKLGPGFMAACGALVLFGPAAIVAWDQLEERRAERLKQKPAPAKDEGTAPMKPEARA